MPDQDITIVLDELQKTIKEKGIDETISILQRSRNPEKVSDNDHIQFVILSVCRQLGTNIEKFIQGQNTIEFSKSSDLDTIKFTKAFIAYYLRCYKEIQIKWDDLERPLGHDQGWLYRLMKIIKKLDPVHPSDAQWYKHKKNLDRIISKYIKNLPKIY